MSLPNFDNLQACMDEARQAALDQDPGPADPLQFNILLGRLHATSPKIPTLYKPGFNAYVQTLNGLGEIGFNQILFQDPLRQGLAALMLDIAQVFLQIGEGFEVKAHAAFQEVVSDLYDGFLSAEDRLGIPPPEQQKIAPLVKFGSPESGPYTFPVDATQVFGLDYAIVSLPPANARRGLFAWPALGHETAGHDILHADAGLLLEVSDAVRNALSQNQSTQRLATYWADRVDETASDVLGILNMGPSVGIGLIAYFRGLNAAFGGGPRLRNTGSSNDVHPADILRGFLAAATIRQLEFSEADAWADAVEAETQKDVGNIVLEGRQVSAADAKLSAEIVAKVIVAEKMIPLNNHAFGEIQNWRNRDESIVERLRQTLTTANPLPADLTEGVFAAHLVAAATTAALVQGANISLLFQRMLDLLKLMNDKNPSFGPLPVRHPGDLARFLAYVPEPQVQQPIGALASPRPPSPRGRQRE